RTFTTITVTIEPDDNDQASSGRRVLIGEVRACCRGIPPLEVANQCRTRRRTALRMMSTTRSAREQRGLPMHSFKRFGARPLGFAAAAAFAVGLVSAGPALTTSAAAAE